MPKPLPSRSPGSLLAIRLRVRTNMYRPHAVGDWQHEDAERYEHAERMAFATYVELRQAREREQRLDREIVLEAAADQLAALLERVSPRPGSGGFFVRVQGEMQRYIAEKQTRLHDRLGRPSASRLLGGRELATGSPLEARMFWDEDGRG